MPPNQKLIQNYLSFKANPNLAMFQELQKIRKEAEAAIQDIARQTERAITKEMEGLRQYISTLTEKAVQEQIFGKISVLKGEKGDSGKDGKSIVGPMGPAGLKGESIVGPQGLSGKDGKSIVGPKGKDGNDGKVPIKGIDYFTKSEIKEFTDKIIDSIKMEKILKEIEELKKMIEAMEKAESFGGIRRNLHRGGLTMVYNEVPTGDVDGSNVTFTLANTPKSGTEMVYVNGMRMQRGGGDYSISGKIITMNTAPPTNSIILVDYENS